ncbi:MULTISPECIES: hypothetical protein [Pacificibacter]|uniref:hypothetical protein n=1 Tax=Pacificibacter TaxID=1042323 RepID=UPI001C08591C|nr:MULTISPECIES: hypothetical protein [Pacificibacter]MBU2935135.1 hypothetical protein [Pacificibacter marinus]MDO6615927.1 hypothetical protein [Pacificibacter sp. 1_MG-2023]
MSIQHNFDNASPANSQVPVPPAVLRFAPLKPKQLSLFKMHDKRTGGDLNHVDLTKQTLNQIEHGHADWIPKLKKRIARMAERNCKNEVRALKAKGRKADAQRRQKEGPKSPWHANTDAPLREGLLTVNKSWFGGSGVDKWDPKKVEDFRAYAMDFLHTYFPGSQLQYAASHSDEEAFHIHFVTATWDSKTTVNRGEQIQLRAAANPILQSYELAQDLVGAHFEEIGITRGARNAEARRQAKNAGLPVPDKRRHVSPSEYREEERRKGRAEAQVIKNNTTEDSAAALKKTRQRASKSERATRRKAKKVEAAQKKATETTKVILDDARDTAANIVRRSRTRAIREANARKAEAERLFKISEAKRESEETAAQRAREEALDAQNLSAAANAQMIRWEKQAQIGLETAAREHDNLTTAKAELQQTENWRDLALKDTEEAQKAATKAMADRNARQAEAEDAKAAQKEAEAALRSTKEHTDTIDAEAYALADGLDYIAKGLLTYRPATEDKDDRLVFSKSTRADAPTRQSIASRIRPAMTRLVDIGRLIFEAVHALLAQERAVMAQDIQTLDDIRKEMGIDANERLDELKARYDAEDALPSL